jgi:hypothetical protein
MPLAVLDEEVVVRIGWVPILSCRKGVNIVGAGH